MICVDITKNIVLGSYYNSYCFCF